MADDAGHRGARGGLRGARARARRRSCSTRVPATRSTRCATRPPTSWPRPCSTCSRARSSGSGRRSRTASTTTSSSTGPSSRTTSPRSRRGWPRASPPTTRSSAASSRRRRGGPSSSSATSRSRSRSSTTSPRRRRPTARRCRRSTVYEHGPFVDLCRGPHVESTGKLGPFKLLAVAGAYWRGDEKRPMLQRIYGTVWPTQEELDQYLWRREEAKKRDHRRLGVQLDLFSFHDVSPGAAFWHPKGWTIWQTLRGRDARDSSSGAATRRSSTPTLVHKKLWEQSGHWEPLRRQHVPGRDRGPDVQPQADELPGVDVHLPLEGALVPRPAAPLSTSTACSTATSGPARSAASRASASSSRTTPTSSSGRTRSRDEIEALIGEVREAYSWFGLSRRFDVRDEAGQGDRRPGRLGARRRRMHAGGARPGPAATYRVKPKDGTFYAPKIDIQIEDALGREWQTATIQVDLTDAARALRPDATSTRRASRSGRSRSTARSTARSSGSSASSSSTSPARSRCGARRSRRS